MLLVQSTFAAGHQPGGEFFDIIDDNNTLILFLSRCRCYKSSDIVLTFFKEFKFSGKEKNIEVLADNIASNLFHHNVDKKRTELMLFTIDLKTLQGKGLNFGNHEVLSTRGGYSIPPNDCPIKTGPTDKTSFAFSLARGETVICLSSGLKTNYKSVVKEDNLGLLR